MATLAETATGARVNGAPIKQAFQATQGREDKENAQTRQTRGTDGAFGNNAAVSCHGNGTQQADAASISVLLSSEVGLKASSPCTVSSSV